MHYVVSSAKKAFDTKVFQFQYRCFKYLINPIQGRHSTRYTLYMR